MRAVALAIISCLVASSPALAEHTEAAREPLRSQRKLELGIHEGVTWPIVNAPIDGPLPKEPKPTEPRPAPPTKAGVRVLAVLDDIESSVKQTSYQARTKVDAKDGVYLWDCSGMAAWIIRKASPAALKNLASPRPVARDFVKA